jgi:hypothetical protein
MGDKDLICNDLEQDHTVVGFKANLYPAGI